jgi:hypothetical protein
MVTATGRGTVPTRHRSGPRRHRADTGQKGTAGTPTIEPRTFRTMSSRPPNGAIQPPRARAFIRFDDLTAAGPTVFALFGVPSGFLPEDFFRTASTILLAGSALALPW